MLLTLNLVGQEIGRFRFVDEGNNCSFGGALMSHFTSFSGRKIGAVALGISLLSVGLAHAQIASVSTNPVFEDNFNASSLDAEKWSTYSTSYSQGQTQFGRAPIFGRDADGTSWMRVPLDTYNPNAPGQSFFGAHVISRKNFNQGSGLEYEARLRMNRVPSDFVLGYFAYGYQGQWTSTYQQTEIDYEFLTSQAGNKVWTNAWDDWNPERGGPRADAMATAPADFNWNDGAWHTYKIRWYPDRTEWIVDNKFVLRRDTTVKPSSPMGVRFNIWGPGWLSSTLPKLAPTATASANQTLGYDVDYVKVRPIPATGTAVWGTGTGLTATYYDTSSFTGTSVTRRDSRVNFNWGAYGPDPKIAPDTWSARWSGWLQPQFSGNYTLTLRTDDGVRLYINNALVINKWVTQGATDSTYVYNATAGAKVPIRIEYFDSSGGASAQFSWSHASTPKQIVPQSQLYEASIVAAPTFSPAGGTYASTQQVAIKTTTPNATVRYTLDGSDPGETSPALAPSSTLRVGSTQLVRAQAFVANQAPSEISSANYVVSDLVVPTVQIASPTAGSWSNAVPVARGTASDGEGSGISRVNVQLRRLSDDVRWTGSEWVAREYGLATRLSTNATGVSWINETVMPVGANLPQGAYELKAIAYDVAGNVGVSLVNFNIDASSPLVTITTPANNATISNFAGITGTLRDAGSGAGRVDVQLRRASDGAIWNGWVWLADNVAMPSQLSGETWSLVAPATNGAGLPTGSNLASGAYEIRAVGFDRAGNASVASAAVTIAASSTSASGAEAPVAGASVESS